jgi:hypothetical protein
MLENIPDRAYERLLRFTQSGHFTTELGLKFCGILKDCNLARHDSEFIELLIKKNVYVEDEELIEAFPDGELKDFVTNETHRFGHEGTYNGKGYALNNQIYNEIYKSADYFIKDSFSYIYEIDTNLLIAEISSLPTNSEKIKFLSQKQSLLWTFFKGEDVSQFLLFMEVPVARRPFNYLEEEEEDDNQEPLFANWEHWATNTLTWESDFMELYLTNCEIKDNFDSGFYETFKTWVNFYRIRELINFCKRKIDEIRKPNSAKTKERKEIEIFKADGLEIFNFIRENQVGKQNNAFYSYLYFFLKTNLKLNVTSNDSATYRRYILANEYVATFSKIIKTEDHSQAKIDAENDFKKTLLSYSDKN